MPDIKVKDELKKEFKKLTSSFKAYKDWWDLSKEDKEALNEGFFERLKAGKIGEKNLTERIQELKAKKKEVKKTLVGK